MVAEFKHQPDAGRQLAAAVVHLGLVDPPVRALPRAEIEQRCQAYRRDGARLDVAGKPVVVVDEGIATGTTVRAALKALRRMRPSRAALAVPVASNDTIYKLSKLVDDVVCLLSQPGFFGMVPR